MKGILFKADMIKAILEGRKTMTRRVIKPQPKIYYTNNAVNEAMLNIDYKKTTYFSFAGVFKRDVARYKKGEIIYVKETWCEVNEDCADNYIQTKAIKYKLDNNKLPAFYKWKSPLFMPECASRIKLQIEDVRVEQLNGISIDDCIAEGIKPTTFYKELDYNCNRKSLDRLSGTKSLEYEINEFKELWDSINKPPYDWNSNPYVFVYSFKQLTKLKEA